MSKILITLKGSYLKARLNRNVPNGDFIYRMLPIKSKINTWGDEIYFSIPVNIPLEDAKEVVSLGDLGYWPPGSAFCIFFGLTPVSRGNEIRPASAVSVFGKVNGDAGVFKEVKSRTKIMIDKG